MIERNDHSTVSLDASFECLLHDCLMIEADDDVLVIYDESLFVYFEALCEVFRKTKIAPTYLFVPKEEQEYLIDKSQMGADETEIRVPASLQAALSASTVIINALDGDLATSAFRGAVVDQPRRDDCRLAHIPGLSDEILEILVRSPTQQILRDAELLAWIFGEARLATLTTTDSRGNAHALTIEMDGWANEPFMSPGIIFPGSWGNIPPGETFCCPSPATVNGRVCVNGSVPGSVLEPGEEIVLQFSAGRLVDWEPKGDFPGCRFLDGAKEHAATVDDRYWNNFAELGVGLNPAIERLTGNSLFDEKALGTVHIAIGDNSFFGHSVESRLHADLVMWNATLQLNDIEVLVNGRLDSEGLRAYRDNWRCPSDMLPDDAMIFVRESKVEFQDGTLKRRLSRAHRVAFVDVAPRAISMALFECCTELETFDSVRVSNFISRHPTFREHKTRFLLNLLYHYRILGLLQTV